MKNCILYLSHVINDDIVNRFKKLKKDVESSYDVYFIFDSGSNDYEKTKKYSDTIDFTYIKSTDLSFLGYKRFNENFSDGNVFWFIQYFVTILNHEEYDNYWLMEYDVVFNGNYNIFFKDIDENLNQDFITQDIMSYRDDENWWWWSKESGFMLNGKYFKYDLSKLLKSFNPIFRLSKNAILYLDEFLKENDVFGHYEYLLPTLLHNNNFSIFSINNDKQLSFTNDKFNKKYSNENTFKYRPNKTRIDMLIYGRNMLYHPLK